MTIIKKIRGFLAHVISGFCFTKASRRHVRKFIENYSFKEAKKYKSFKHQIISLGNSCMARTITTKYGLKPKKIYGEKTIITDQLLFPLLRDFVELWNNDFKGMFDDCYRSEERQAWLTEKYKIYAPHEYSLNKKEFLAAMKRRIENFKEILKTDKFAIFLRFETHNFTLEDVKSLAKKVKEARCGKPYKLIIVNHKKPVTEVIDENTIIINTPLTLSEKWQLELDTEEGKKFCATFIEPIKKIIEEINS